MRHFLKIFNQSFWRCSQDKNSLLGFFPVETSVPTRIKFLCFKWSISTTLFHQVKCINCEKDVIALAKKSPVKKGKNPWKKIEAFSFWKVRRFIFQEEEEEKMVLLVLYKLATDHQLLADSSICEDMEPFGSNVLCTLQVIIAF